MPFECDDGIRRYSARQQNKERAKERTKERKRDKKCVRIGNASRGHLWGCFVYRAPCQRPLEHILDMGVLLICFHLPHHTSHAVDGAAVVKDVVPDHRVVARERYERGHV